MILIFSRFFTSSPRLSLPSSLHISSRLSLPSTLHVCPCPQLFTSVPALNSSRLSLPSSLHVSPCPHLFTSLPALNSSRLSLPSTLHVSPCPRLFTFSHEFPTSLSRSRAFSNIYIDQYNLLWNLTCIYDYDYEMRGGPTGSFFLVLAGESAKVKIGAFTEQMYTECWV